MEEKNEETNAVVTIDTGTTIEDSLKQEVIDLVSAAKAVSVITGEDRAMAYEVAKKLKDGEGVITKHYEPMRKAAHDAKQVILDSKKKSLEPVIAALGIVKKKITVFDQEQARLKAEAEKKAREKAEAEAEAERLRLQKIADEAATKGDEQAFEEAAYEVEQVTTESMMEVAQPTAKAQGQVQNWQATVVDKRKLIKAALERPELFDAIIADEKWLGQIAKSTKGKMAIPGVQFNDVGTVRLT